MKQHIKKLVRENKPMKDWILDLVSEDENVRDKACKILSAMMYGIPNVDMDLLGIEFDEKESEMFSDEVSDVFLDNAFPATKVMCGLLDILEKLYDAGKIEQLIIYNEIIKNAGPGAIGAIEKLIDLINNDTKDCMISETAAVALGNIGSPAKCAFDPLFYKMCKSRNPLLFSEHLAKIVKDDDKLVGKIINNLNSSKQYVAKIKASLHVLLCLNINFDIMETLNNLLNHKDEEIQWLVLYEFGNIGKENEQIKEILLDIIKNETGHKKSVAIESLAKTCDETALVVPILVNALGDDEYSFCQYEGCVESAVGYLLKFVEKESSIEIIKDALPILLNDIEEMDCISNEDDMIDRVKLIGRFGASAKAALPKLKEFLDSWLEDDPKAKDESTKIFKDSVDNIEAGLKEQKRKGK